MSIATVYASPFFYSVRVFARVGHVVLRTIYGLARSLTVYYFCLYGLLGYYYRLGRSFLFHCVYGYQVRVLHLFLLVVF